MGYYTDYSLKTLREGKVSIKQFLDGIRGTDIGEVFQEDIEDLDEMIEEDADAEAAIALTTEEGCRWYDWKEDMLKLSGAVPDAVFCLSGEGEESGDLWKCYFKGGKSQYAPAQIVFDDYDESCLE